MALPAYVQKVYDEEIAKSEGTPGLEPLPDVGSPIAEPEVNQGAQGQEQEQETGYTFDYDTNPEAKPYKGYIDAAEAKHGIPKNLLANLIKAESHFNPRAVSGDGAKGIMQIVPKWHPDVNPLDTPAAIDYGAGYLRKMYNKFGTWEQATAAYNTGPGNLQKLGMEGLYDETVEYNEKIHDAKLPGVDSPIVGPKADQTGGLPSYVKEAMERESSTEQPKDPRSEPQEWDPEWMREHPNLAGLYGAGRGILEQAVVPAIEATGAVAGSLFGPVVGTALGWGIARQLNDVLVEGYNRLGGEAPTSTTISEEMKQSAADVGTALILGKATEMGARAAPHIENYLFNTLPKRLYGSAIKTPMSKKWVQTLPDEVLSKQTAVIQEGLDSRIATNEQGLAKIKSLQKEAVEYIDDITKILSTDPSKTVGREALLEKGLERAYIKATNSSDPVAAKGYVDAIAKRFRAHSKNLTPAKANQIKRQLYEEVKYGGTEPSAIKAQIDSSGKKGVAREIMLNLEEMYPALKDINATDAARIGLVEAIEKAYAKEATKNLVPLGAKILLRPKAWPLAIWEGTMGHPRVKTQLAFLLHKANPAVYPAKPSAYVPPKQPAPVKPTEPLRYEPPVQPLVKGTKPDISLPRVKSSGAVSGPQIDSKYTPDQLNKMSGLKDITQEGMALDDFIETIPPSKPIVKGTKPDISLPRVESSKAVSGSQIEGKYTPDQLSKMLGSKNATRQEMAIDDIIETRKNVGQLENERRSVVNDMLKTFKDDRGPVPGGLVGTGKKNLSKPAKQTTSRNFLKEAIEGHPEKGMTKQALDLGREIFEGKVNLKELKAAHETFKSMWKDNPDLVMRNQYFTEAFEFAEILGGKTAGKEGKIKLMQMAGDLPKNFGKQTVYHGGTGTSKNKIAFFADKKSDAKWYANERGGPTKNIIAKEVNISKPANVDDVIKAAKEAGVKIEEGPHFYAKEISKHSPNDGWNPNDLLYIPKVIKALKKKGFDGFKGWDALENKEIPITVTFPK